MLGITKPCGSFFELAAALDVDVKRSVRQDVGNLVVIEEWLKRPQPDHVVAEVGGKRRFLEFVELCPILGCYFADQLRDFPAQTRAWNAARYGRVDPGHQHRPDPLLKFAEQRDIGDRGSRLDQGGGYERQT